MFEVKDVSGKILEVGDTVAFCIGGRGTVMRLGVVKKLTDKSVVLDVPENRLTYNDETRRYDKVVVVDTKVVRPHAAVSKVFNVEVSNV